MRDRLRAVRGQADGAWEVAAALVDLAALVRRQPRQVTEAAERVLVIWQLVHRLPTPQA